jgi:hypothetical protein
VIFDTGSDWLSVPSNDCTSCVGGAYELPLDGKKHDYLENTTAYGNSAVLKGHTYKDKVCINTEP